jgi:hypothetical protein
VIFCGKCGQRNGWPMSSVRANRVPCDICGGFDQLQVKSRSGIRTMNLPNYSYPTNLLPSVVERDDESVEQQ